MLPAARSSLCARASGGRRSPRSPRRRSSRSGASRVRPYAARAWSIWAPLNPLYEAGRYEEVADRARELLEEYPESAGLLYNVACCESLAGRTADALEHLRRSTELSDRFRALAKDDSDFDPIRDEPAFKELVGR